MAIFTAEFQHVTECHRVWQSVLIEAMVQDISTLATQAILVSLSTESVDENSTEQHRIRCVSACLCMCEKSKPVLTWFDSVVSLSRCITCVHHPLFNYIRRQTARSAFIVSKLLDVTSKQPERERDRCPRALIVSTIDMSNNQRLHRHAIQISSHRHLWYCSRHCSFVVPHVRHGTTSPPPPPLLPASTHTPNTHTLLTSHSSLSEAEMTIDV